MADTRQQTLRAAFWLAILAVIIGTSVTLAACPSVRFVKQQVQAVAVPQVAFVPSYGASYAQTSGEVEVLLRQLIAEVQQLRIELRQAKGEPIPAPNTTTAAGVFEAACLKCHQTATADKQGGGFVMYEVGQDGKGQLAQFSIKEKERILRRVENGTMPPKDFMLTSKLQLDGGSKKLLTDWLTKNQNEK